MSDNVEITAGSGTNIATDDIGGVQHQRVKISQGADGVGTDVSSAAPLQVTVANTGANATAVKVNVASGGIASGAVASGSIVDGAMVTIGSKTDAKSTATDTTSVSGISVWKQVSASVQSAAAFFATLAVGAPSTAAVAADPALIVSESPNSIFGGRGDAASTEVSTGAVSMQSVVKNVSDYLQRIYAFFFAEDAAHSSGDKGIMSLAVRRDANTAVAGTDGDYIPITTDSIGNVWVQISKVAGVVPAFGSGAVGSTVQRITLADDSAGIIDPANFVRGCITSKMASTTSTSLIAAPGASLRNYVTQITVACDHATQGTNVLIQDGSDGTTLWVIPAAAVFGGATIDFPIPLKQPTTNTALYCKNETTGSSTNVSANGYKAA